MTDSSGFIRTTGDAATDPETKSIMGMFKGGFFPDQTRRMARFSKGFPL